ncbi:MAG TPA: hypothetical protein VMZ00_13805 [Sporichthya sp.]|nr:hypothetical protein [Sporichthya sp.]
MASVAPRSRAALCALLAGEFPTLEVKTVEDAVDHAVRVAEQLSGSAEALVAEALVWARAGVIARDHLDVAVHHARRLAALRRTAPLAV